MCGPPGGVGLGAGGSRGAWGGMNCEWQKCEGFTVINQKPGPQAAVELSGFEQFLEIPHESLGVQLGPGHIPASV